MILFSILNKCLIDCQRYKIIFNQCFLEHYLVYVLFYLKSFNSLSILFGLFSSALLVVNACVIADWIPMLLLPYSQIYRSSTFWPTTINLLDCSAFDLFTCLKRGASSVWTLRDGLLITVYSLKDSLFLDVEYLRFTGNKEDDFLRIWGIASLLGYYLIYTFCSSLTMESSLPYVFFLSVFFFFFFRSNFLGSIFYNYFSDSSSPLGSESLPTDSLSPS